MRNFLNNRPSSLLWQKIGKNTLPPTTQTHLLQLHFRALEKEYTRAFEEAVPTDTVNLNANSFFRAEELRVELVETHLDCLNRKREEKHTQFSC